MRKVTSNAMQQENAQYRKMRETPVSKLIIMLGIPTTISMLVTNIYNMADTYFVGRLWDKRFRRDRRCIWSYGDHTGIRFYVWTWGGQYHLKTLGCKGCGERLALCVYELFCFACCRRCDHIVRIFVFRAAGTGFLGVQIPYCRMQKHMRGLSSRRRRLWQAVVCSIIFCGMRDMRRSLWSVLRQEACLIFLATGS